MENAFTPCPVCSPARASFHTGRIPSVHGIHDHIGEQSVGAGHPGIAGQTSFAEVLQGQGYQTGLVGKWHLNHFRQPPPGWEVRAGLSFDVLKNADAALGRVLARAAQRENHVLYAAIFSIYECGTVDESGDFPGWDEPEDFNWDDEDWDEEQIDSTRELFGLVASDGSRPDYGALPLLAGELLPAGALDGVEPDHEDTTVTGNEGVQMSRSYRRAALVLWPGQRTVGTLARGGIEHALAWFADDLARSEHDPGARRHLSGLAAQLIDTWPAPDPARY